MPIPTAQLLVIPPISADPNCSATSHTSNQCRSQLLSYQSYLQSVPIPTAQLLVIPPISADPNCSATSHTSNHQNSVALSIRAVSLIRAASFLPSCMLYAVLQAFLPFTSPPGSSTLIEYCHSTVHSQTKKQTPWLSPRANYAGRATAACRRS
jgi:hypothetical protein